SNALGYSTFCCNPDLEVLHIPTTRIHKDHPLELIIGDLHSALLTRRQSQQNLQEHALVFSNKKDERGIVVMNKARLVAQGHTQDEGIDYDEVFAPVARIKAIRLFLAYASFKDFVVYQMDVKSAFLYEKIKEEVYVCQPPGFEDPNFPDKVYKVEKALYGLHQAPRAWYETLSSYLLDNGYHRGQIDKSLFIKRHEDDILLIQIYVDDIIFGSTKKEMSVEFEKTMHRRFQMSYMGELTFFLGLQVKQKDNGIFIRQDKYVAEILMKFDFATIKTASTPIEPNKTLLKDEEADDVDVHLYRLMIGLLMYLTASIPDIMFAVCACASDYGGASIDRKSTTGGCQFLGKRLNLWQCKKQTIVANSTTEAKYVATANCCGQVLWIQNQMLDYGFDFMHTKINIDNESIITIVKNPKLHGKTKHIEIKHHFIKDCHEKKLIQTIKIHTDQNVGDLLTKGFDVSRFKKHCLRGGIYDGIFLQVLVSNHITNGHQFTMSHRHQELASPKQTTIALAIPGQTANEVEEEGSADPVDPIESLPSTSQSQPRNESRKSKKKTTKDRINLTELMKMRTKLSDRVLALETEKASQALEISSLKKQVKRLEKKVSKRTHKLKRLYKIGTTKRVQSSDDEVLGAKEDASKQVRIHEAMDDEIEATQENDSIMFDTTVLDSEEVVTTVENEVSAAPSIPTVSTDIEVSTAPVSVAPVITSIQTASTIVSTITPEEVKDVVVEKSNVPVSAATITTVDDTTTTEAVVSPTTATTEAAITFDSRPKAKGAKDKGKTIMIEPEKPLKPKDQIKADEQLARELVVKEE
ncbi:putative ribonuclease H-like domain-containing protein, partial [Tanacetum coccineum]